MRSVGKYTQMGRTSAAIWRRARAMIAGFISICFCAHVALAQGSPAPQPADHGPAIGPSCQLSVLVLGAGQDAGAPQIGNPDDPAWSDPSLALTPSSIALLDHRTRARYLFDATPAITAQLQRADTVMRGRSSDPLGLAGVFLTHAHIGHYAGLMFAGREAAGARNLKVYAMPRMAGFLRANGPWSQLVTLNNIALQQLNNQVPRYLPGGIAITPYRVPHRDEFSETVGFVMTSPQKSALYLPDIDSWAEWRMKYDIDALDMVAKVDFAFVDATFFSDDELPGRDMSEIPHPRVAASMDLFDQLPEDARRGIHFIHYNHTNPVRFANSRESQLVTSRGYNIARAGAQVCLVEGASP